MRACVCAVLLVACGDNIVPIAPPLEHADALFVVGHPDDDMIFMQPELLRALGAGSVTTIYVTTAGPDGANLPLFESTLVAYGAIVGSTAWDCGSLALGGATVDHCRLRDRPVSLVNFDLPDGGIPGDRPDSLLHLVDGTTPAMPMYGPAGGTITMASVVELFAAALAATSPAELHTLDLAATHGRDHSSHLFVASFALWAAARLGFDGAVTWHRGYNVEPEAPTLLGDDFAAAQGMLGYYEACAELRTCGEPSTTLLPEHATWLARQYSSARVREGAGALASGDRCLDAALALGDCASGIEIQLTATGALRIDNACLASTADGGLVRAVCAYDPAQYWVLDGEGFLWNGRPPLAAGDDMTFDHVRCLSEGSAGTCGMHLHPAWQFR